MMPTPHSAIAWPCLARGQASRMKACASGAMNAPKAPCNMRNTTICSSDCASPHSIDAATKPATDHRNNCRRPIFSASQPVSGVAMAVATI